MTGYMKKIMTSFLLFMAVPLLIIYLLIGIVFYFNQEKLFFKPIKLAKNYTFKFNQDFEEIKSATKDGTILNSLLFKIKNSKGVIFYLHGNGNSLEKFGKLAPIYTNLGYDIFMTDYRGYGKSEGALSDENQLFEDNQFLYNELKKSYKEEDIIIIGYSLGSSLAAKLASENTPKLLVLKAPFYNFKDVANHTTKLTKLYPFNYLSKYHFKTNEFIKLCKMPLLIFHGTEDEVVYYGSSIKLQKYFKPTDRLVSIEGEKHRTIIDNPLYIKELERFLLNNEL